MMGRILLTDHISLVSADIIYHDYFIYQPVGVRQHTIQTSSNIGFFIVCGDDET